MALGASLVHAVTGTVGSRHVGIARIVVGMAALLKLAILAPTLLALRNPAILRIPLDSRLPALPGEMIPLVIGVWLVSAVLFTVGWRTRASGTLLSAAMLSTLLGDQQLYSNHLYLALTVTALLTLGDAGAAVSMDARDRGRRREVPAWPVLLLRAQVTIVYGFAALAKLNLAYISGAVLNAQLGWGSILPVPDALRRWEVMSLLALISILTEAFLALALWFSHTRPLGIAVGVAFHVAIVLGMDPTVELIVFSLLMSSLYILHLDPRVRAPAGTGPVPDR